MRQLSLVVILLFIVGCKPGNSSESSKNEKKTSTAAAPASSTSPTSSTETQLTSTKLLQSNLKDSATLTEMLKASKKRVGVFQFSGVTCSSCQVESPEVSKALSKYADKVQLFVIFPNKASDYATSDYQGFVSKYATGATFAVDDAMELLKKTRTDKSQFFGLYVLLKDDGTVKTLTTTEAYRNVGCEVQKLLGGTTSC